MLYMYWNIDFANIHISFIKPEVEKNIESKNTYRNILNNYSMPVFALEINNYSMQQNSHYLSTDSTGEAEDTVAVIHTTDDERMNQRSGSFDCQSTTNGS